MCFAATGRLQGRAAKLLLERRKSWYNEDLASLCLTANGPAIWGGCVTWRSHTATGPGTPSTRGRKVVPVARQVWHAFLPSSPAEALAKVGSRYRFDRRMGYSLGRQSSDKALAQCRGTNCLGAGNLSWCRILIVCSCANPNAGFVASPCKWLRVMPVRPVSAGRAKSMTNNLPILSVLALVFIP
jgi:hypothetical protein